MKIKGIGFTTKITGGTIFLKWRDPRDSNRQRQHSAETNDRTEAEHVALWLSRLVHTPDYWHDPPNDAHPVALRIWGAELFAERVAAAVHIPENPHDVELGFGAMNSAAVADRLRRGLPPELSEEEIENRKREDLNRMRAVERLKGIDLEIINLKEERDKYRNEVRRLRSIIKQMGKRGELNLEPVELSVAIQDYLASSTGSRATGQFRKTVEWWLKAFEKKFGAKHDVKTFDPDEVSEYLGSLLKEASAGTVRQRMNQLCRFLRTASCGMFDERVVKNNLLPLLKKNAEEKEDEEWFWLPTKDATKLIAKMRERHGDFWADAAMIQYGCALRPEEIPLLQTDAVRNQKNRLQIKIQRIELNGAVLRRIKTKRSKGYVDVPTWAAKSIQRRLAEKKFLLFPNPKPEGKRIEQKLMLWPSADDGSFSGHYLRRLRDAAKEAGLDSTKIDSRVLRRTRARQIAEKHGLASAAVFIRDSVETLRKHYADLDSGDIRVSN